LKELYESYKNDVQFLVVYIREAHPIDSLSMPRYEEEMIEDPINDIERTAVAKICMAKMALRPIPAVVDRIDDKANNAYRGWPDRLFLVGKDGKMAYSGGRGPGGFRPDELRDAIEKELARIKARAKGSEVLETGPKKK